jgi:aldehyde:ferredoxin oxidoreductase
MRYAETGYNLEVDLTRGNIERVETDPSETELYLGGLGTNAKYCGTGFRLMLSPFRRTICSYLPRVFYAAHLPPVATVPLSPPFRHRLS